MNVRTLESLTSWKSTEWFSSSFWKQRYTRCVFSKRTKKGFLSHRGRADVLLHNHEAIIIMLWSPPMPTLINLHIRKVCQGWHVDIGNWTVKCIGQSFASSSEEEKEVVGCSVQQKATFLGIQCEETSSRWEKWFASEKKKAKVQPSTSWKSNSTGAYCL